MNDPHPRAIDVADGGDLTEDSAEVVRVWVTNNAGATVYIDAGVLADPRVFGYLMADTVRHGAKAYAAAHAIGEDEALQAIVDGLGAELREQFASITPIDQGRTN